MTRAARALASSYMTGGDRMIQAVILAAGRCGTDFRQAFGVTHKCLIEADGRPMVRWVLDAVRRVPSVSRVVVVGPPEALRAAGVDVEIVANDGDSHTESLGRGITALAGERVLAIAADVPLLESEELDEWIRRCLATDADFCLPVVSWDAVQLRLPGARKTWYDLRDGKFTKGNATVGRRDCLASRMDRIESLFCAQAEEVDRAGVQSIHARGDERRRKPARRRTRPELVHARTRAIGSVPRGSGGGCGRSVGRGVRSQCASKPAPSRVTSERGCGHATDRSWSACGSRLSCLTPVCS